MRYRELVQFEPIETVIQLREADAEDKARRLVQTYVISDRMADQLTSVIVPQLQFLTPQDNKGILVVGNYGTGKSHLMSVVSALAEYPGIVDSVNDPRVRAAAQAVSGRFKVARVEIGGVTGSLRDIILRELEVALDRWEVPFSFPAADRLTNNKDAIVHAVAKFRERYPDQGMLLVVDELLDYLRTRHERELILDLGFLRELGEVPALAPFRFVAGLQESLFDSPRFAFVADPLRRVRERFEMVRIAREDIAFVVAHRLLRKTDRQLALITEHLHRFSPLYRRLAERLPEFAQLFPIHPAYIETFERVYVAEKREVLKTFSLAMRDLLDQEVPEDEPGLVSYDHYWDILRENPAMRSEPDVALVIDKSNVLEGRVTSAYTRPNLLPMALRIIHALSVHRLTTSGIRQPLGATPTELRDDLCLFLRMPEPTADFLQDQVKVALEQIIRTVSGQFIAHNSENGQYYLDVERVVDFDAKIVECGDLMGDDDLNRYFFDALRQILNLNDTTYITGHRIWFWELPWPQRQVTRPGYLFFGAPDERSTAQPPRDFYVYILPPFFPRELKLGDQPDEVIFQLVGLDETFRQTLRLYAGARAMATESTDHRAAYAAKAQDQFGRLNGWLRDHLAGHLQVTYQGVSKPVAAVLATLRSTASTTWDELVRLVASHHLAPQFAERYPNYPGFARLSQPVSEEARPVDAMEAVRYLAGQGRTNLRVAVLEALELLDAQGGVRPAQSRYARRYLEILQAKPAGQVVNRSELIEVLSADVAHYVEKDITFHLEPEWVAVVLVALVYNGDIVLTINGQTELDANSIDRAATLAIADLVNFRFYKQPRSLPLGQWVAIFEGLGLAPGMIRDEGKREEAVKALQQKVGAEASACAALIGRVQQGLTLWNERVFTDPRTFTVDAHLGVTATHAHVELGTTDLLVPVRRYKQYLESLAPFNTVGKLRNLKLTAETLAEAVSDRKVMTRVEELLTLVDHLQPLTTYLAEAQANLPADHDWSQQAAAQRESLLAEVRRFGRGEAATSQATLAVQLADLKKDYVAAYAQEHRRIVLNPQGDDRRQRLYKDPRLAALNALSSIDLLNREELKSCTSALAGLPTCREFHEGAIAETPTCPFCQLRPAQKAGAAQASASLESLDARLSDILLRWRQALRANLSSDTVRQSLAAMTPVERKPIEAFLAQTDEDPAIPLGFASVAAQALRGISAVELHVEDIIGALKKGGLPCTVDEMGRRFQASLDDAVRGHDARNTRLTLDQ